VREIDKSWSASCPKHASSRLLQIQQSIRRSPQSHSLHWPGL
jgi:hypothetical protein